MFRGWGHQGQTHPDPPLNLGQGTECQSEFPDSWELPMVGSPELSPPQEPALPSPAVGITLPSSLG